MATYPSSLILNCIPICTLTGALYMSLRSSIYMYYYIHQPQSTVTGAMYIDYVACPVIGDALMVECTPTTGCCRHATNLFALTHSHPRGTSLSPLLIPRPVISLQMFRLLGTGKQMHILLPLPSTAYNHHNQHTLHLAVVNVCTFHHYQVHRHQQLLQC